ncbi:MAG TPA: sigma-54 dependent transcriptional regulator [Nitrospiria bacterium]
MKNPTIPDSKPYGSEKPWVTGFLPHQLIRYMQEHYPEEHARINYKELLGVVKGFEPIPDPQSFLIDPNHWLPQEVLQALLKKCEEITGDSNIAYQAALDHFLPKKGKTSTPFEKVASLLGDMRLSFLCAPLWASVYTNNYLKLQPFQIPNASSSIGLLAQFIPHARTRWSNHLLVRGNCEGFGRLYEFIETVSCEEEYIQIRLEDLVLDFPDYHLLTKGERKIFIEKQTKQPVIEATSVLLTSEPVPSIPEVEAFSKDLLVLIPQNGWLAPLTSHSKNHATGQEEHTAYQIQKGGTLHRQGTRLTLKKGLIFNAPYSRYTFHWKERPSRKERPKNVPIKQVTHFIFNHLRELSASHQKLLGAIIKNAKLSSENQDLRREVTHTTRFLGFVGTSHPMKQVYSQIQAVSNKDATVLITGETGTGKELVAKALHTQGPRAQGRFLALNCGALSESLLESELFGHERGAFTGAVQQHKGKFELAHQGTLFLDEIGEISPSVQVKLLRVLQEKCFQRVGGTQEIHVDVRIIAATNQDLEALVKSGGFRGDLFYRIHVFPIHLPPLRERKDDIPLLVEHFIQKMRLKYRHQIQRITPEAMENLMTYNWPGNVRELEYCIERSIILAGNQTELGKGLLPQKYTQKAYGGNTALGEMFDQLEWDDISHFIHKKGSIDSLLNQFEWRIVQRAIEGNGGNKSQAARALNRSYRWLRKLEQRQEQSGQYPL